MSELNNICEKCGKEFSGTPENGSLCPICAAVKRTESKDLEPGTTINGFEIIKQIGKGGMGTVYLAWQKSMQRQVALKVLNPEITKDADSVQQFLNEVRNTGKLQHPNIVNAFDSGEENGVYYLAMQYINGDTLDAMLQKDGPMNEIRCLEYSLQIANALEYVWSKYQMFHRDIKPGNFMLNDDGKVMLMDMGIAQKIGDTREDDDHVEGSPYYMSPEQIQGAPLSWTTDQYSLGASLYQLIVGVPPYDDKSIDEILKKHCLSEFPEPSERKPGCKISPETAAILKRMLDKDPAKRYPSWEEYIKDAKNCIELLKEIEKNPDKRLELDAAAMAEKKLRDEKKKKLITVICISAAVVLLTGVLTAGYFLISAKNTEQAEKMAAVLQESIRKFEADPGLYSEIKTDIEKTEKAARRLGVASEIQNQLLAAVDAAEKKSNTLYRSYSKFERESAECHRMIAKVKNLLAEISSGRSLRLENIEDAAGQIVILESRKKNLTPVIQKQKEQKERIESSIDVMKRSVEECRKKLTEAELTAAERTIRQVSQQTEAASASTARSISAELSKKEAEATRAAAEVRRRAQAAENARKSVKVQTAKKEVDVLLPKIKQAQAKLRADFLNALMEIDIRKAAAVTIPEEIRDAQKTTPAARNAYAELQKEYSYFRKLSEDAMVVWNELQNLQNMNIIKGISVYAPPNNKRLKQNMLKVEKIENGKVYFQEAGSVPEDFLYIAMQDKERISRHLIYRKRELAPYAFSFYFFFGLYDLAYMEAKPEERAKVLALAKNILTLQYQSAKKTNDIRILQRLKRDYGKNKALSVVLK